MQSKYGAAIELVRGEKKKKKEQEQAAGIRKKEKQPCPLRYVGPL
jgi:hypothetical protein